MSVQFGARGQDEVQTAQAYSEIDGSAACWAGPAVSCCGDDTDEQRNRIQRIDDEHGAQAHFVVAERLEDLRSVCGQTVEKDMCEKDPERKLCPVSPGGLFQLLNPLERSSHDRSTENHEEEGVHEGAVHRQGLYLGNERSNQNIEVGYESRTGPQVYSAIARFVTEREFAHGSSEGHLGNGIH